MAKLVAIVKEHRTPILIFIGAFLVRASYALLVQIVSGSHGFISYSDAEFFYYRAAVNLLEHHVFSIAEVAPFYPDAYHTPLYPLFVAVVLSMKFSLFGVILVQSILAAITVVLIYRIAHIFTASRRIALMAAALAMFEPMSIYWNGLLMSDTLFALLFIAGIYFLATRRLFLMAFMLGLAALTRPIALYLAPLFIFMGAYVGYSSHHAARTTLRNAFFGIVIVAATVFPWFLHNKITSDTWAFSSASWYLFYNFPLREYVHREGLAPLPTTPPDVDTDLTRFDFQNSPAYQDAFFSVVSRDPIGYAMTYGTRSIYSLVSNRYEYLITVVIRSQLPVLYDRLPAAALAALLYAGAASWAILYALMAVSFREITLRAWWVFFIILLSANLFLSGGVNPVGTDMSRYLFGLYPFFFMFAGVGLREIYRLYVRWRA